MQTFKKKYMTIDHEACLAFEVKIDRGESITKGSFLQDLMDTPDPYVILRIPGSSNSSRRTSHVDNCINPIWDETFHFYLDPSKEHHLKVVLMNANYTVDETLGEDTFCVNELTNDIPTKHTFIFPEGSKVYTLLTLQKNKTPDLRFSLALCQQEKAFLQIRRKKVLVAMKKLLADKAPDTEKKVPIIGVLGSGGGFRAMTCLSGAVKALQESGILDCVTYIAGLSGSTWYISTLYAHDAFPNVTHAQIQKELEASVTEGWKRHLLRTPQYVASMVAKYRLGQPVSLTDFFGHLLGDVLLKELKHKKLTESQRILVQGIVPMPLYTGLHAKNKVSCRSFSEWVEFSPYEIGIPKYGTFMKTQDFGSKFIVGKKIKTFEEFPLHFLQGVWGSAFTILIKRLVMEGGKKDIVQIMRDAQKDDLEKQRADTHSSGESSDSDDEEYIHSKDDEEPEEHHGEISSPPKQKENIFLTQNNTPLTTVFTADSVNSDGKHKATEMTDGVLKQRHKKISLGFLEFSRRKISRDNKLSTASNPGVAAEFEAGASSGTQADASSGTQAGASSGTQAGASSGTQAGASSGTQAGASSGTQAGASSGTQAGASSGTQAGASSGTQAGASSGTQAGASSGTQAGASSGTQAGASSGTQAGASSGTQAGASSGTQAGASSGTQAGASSGTQAGASSGTQAGASSGTQAGASSGTQAGASSGTQAGASSGTQAGASSGTQAGASSGTQAGASSGTQAGASSGTQAGASSGTQADNEGSQLPTQGNVNDAPGMKYFFDKRKRLENSRVEKKSGLFDGLIEAVMTGANVLNARAGRAGEVLSPFRGLSLRHSFPVSPIAALITGAHELDDQVDSELDIGICSRYEPLDNTAKKLFIVDSGLAFNSPYPLLLRPQRAVDIYLSFDFSQRPSDKAQPFKELLLAEKWALQNQVVFPPIQKQVAQYETQEVRECYVFKHPTDMFCPVILHFPLVNNKFKNFKAPGVPRKTEDEIRFADFPIFDDPLNSFSSMNFAYEKEQFERLTKLVEFNTLLCIDTIKKVIEDSITRNKNFQQNRQNLTFSDVAKIVKHVSYLRNKESNDGLKLNISKENEHQLKKHARNSQEPAPGRSRPPPPPPPTTVGQRATNVGQRATNVGQRVTNVGQQATNVGQQATNVGQRATNVGQRATRDKQSYWSCAHQQT